MIPVKAKYIPILGKNVNSRVFDEVMKFEFIKKDKVKLANPFAINLRKYYSDLRSLLEALEKRINYVSWKFLSEDDKKK